MGLGGEKNYTRGGEETAIESHGGGEQGGDIVLVFC